MSLSQGEIVIDCTDHEDDLAAGLERLAGLVASVLARRSLGDDRWVVLADPHGNEFCVGST